MSYRYLPEPGAVSSAPSCSDGNQSGTSNGTNTVSKSSRKESKTDSSIKPQSSETLTSSSSPVQVKNTRGLSTWLRQAFPANHSALQASKEAKTTKGTSGRKRSNVFAMFDPDTRSWKTSQVCLILDTLAKSSLRWPKQGSMQDGVCSEQTMWAPRTDAKDSGLKRLAKTPSAADAYTGNMKKNEFKFGNSGSLAQEVESGFLETHRKWPTPSVSDTEGGQQSDRVEQTQSGAYILRKKNKPDSTFGAKLSDAVLFEEKKMWPTPRANSAMASTISPESAWAENRFPNLETVVGRTMWPTPAAHEGRLGYQRRDTGKKGTQKSLSTEVIDNAGGRNAVTGQLNPTWVEWLMGWPLGWTDLKPLETDKYRQWLQLHGRS